MLITSFAKPTIFNAITFACIEIVIIINAIVGIINEKNYATIVKNCAVIGILCTFN